MNVNPKLKEMFSDISKASTVYHNLPDPDRKILKRLLRTFKNNLKEEEQVYVMKMLFEQIQYKNIITDPDNIIQIHNVKLRSTFIQFIMCVLIMIVIAALFRTNAGLNSVIDAIGHVFSLVSI